MKNAYVTNSLKGALLIGVVGAIAWVIAGLPSTFDPDLAPVGYVGQPVVSSPVLYTGNVAANRTRLYAIDYDGTDWSGNLHSFPLTSTGSIVKTDDWTGGAATIIDAQSPTATTGTARKIITRDGTGANVQFRWALGGGITTMLSSDQKTNTIWIANGDKRLNYIRGARSDEYPSGNDYRKRTSTLGDIIHSTPVYCDSSDCATGSTAGTIFVGANDGMLHAINAADGSERFAYIPAMLIPNLVKLTARPYTHTSFVDGRMDFRKFGSQTILAGALGGGGKGLFALDVTNTVYATESALAASNKILWEITNTTTSFDNLGYTYGQPVLATIPGPLNALIVGNGYANSGNFKASLFIINAATGALIHESVTTDNTPTTSNRSGLSSPTLVDEDGDGKADFAYAGDLNGNLWKFKLSSPWDVTKLYTVNPAQPITMQPGVTQHPTGVGFMVTFVTGQMLMPDDSTNTATYAAYGIWDGAPVTNTTILNQTLTERSYTTVSPAIRVRTATNNIPDWTAGHHLGWRTELPTDGERVTGDGAYVSGGVFQFMTMNPTITATPPTPDGENWWMQLNAYTGGDVGSIRFDLDSNSAFTSADQVSVDVGGVATPTSPVGRNMGPGRRSQLTAINAGSYTVYQANYDKNTGEPPPPGDLGISGGHFDYDTYTFSNTGTAVYTATGTPSTGDTTTVPNCLKTTDVNNQVNTVSTTYCKTAQPYGMPNGYGLLLSTSPGAKCGDPKQPTYWQTISCSAFDTFIPPAGYAKKVHVHEYDDKYNVTGVNNLHPSESLFKINAWKPFVDNPNQPFKILVMNQFLNPAAFLRVGPNADEISVKTYGNLASETNPATLLSGLTVYTVGNIGNFIYNLPKTAFQSKDWWGTVAPIRNDGDGQPRSGLIPTQTGCVNGMSSTGVSGRLGPNGERFDGALAFQVIRDTTPDSALEMNRAGDVRYGWRVKASVFSLYVLGEYSTFWHHFNGKCYGDTGWIQNPPQDSPSTIAESTPDELGDPKGLFGGPGTPGGDPTVVSVTTTTTNGQTTTTTTYSNGTVVITYPDGSTKTTTSDGTITWSIPGIDTGGVVNTGGGGSGSPGNDSADPGGVRAPGEPTGRINWRELRR